MEMKILQRRNINDNKDLKLEIAREKKQFE